ncbi:hypothetical protein ACHAQC_010595 [Fusarium culmorum]
MAARLKSQGQQRQERSLSLDEALYNHLALPPHLPHRQDSNLNGIENALTDRLLASVKHLQSLPNNGHSAVWDSVRRGVETTKSIHIGGHVDRTALARELSGLGDSDFLAVYVSSQNCALYIRRSLDPVLGASVVFEAFETSARNEDVLATDNALQWDFPGCAVAVPLDTFHENGFVSHLANFLDNASRETLSEFSAHALKAGASMPEYRNASEPALISSMLMGILQQSGRRLAPTILQKMVRDDVLWRNAEKPWRRLPHWLVLRVAISRYLAQRLGGEVGRIEYKFLLAHLLSEFLSHVQRTNIGIDRLDFLKKKICRRLVKLDLDNERAQDPSTTDRVEYLLSRLSPGIQNAVSKANQFIEASWKQQKLAMTKTVPVLPKQATLEDTRVDLKISGQYLYKIWQGFSRPVRFGLKQQNTVSVAQAAKQHLSSFAREHFKLIDKEMSYNKFCDDCGPFPRLTIETASNFIKKYLPQSSVYVDIPELKSTMILNIMDLWVTMDKAACSLYPILGEFHPLFRPEMIDVLILPKVAEMKRLQRVQVYLQDRIVSCRGSTVSIFDDPVRGSFAHRFYDSSDMSDEMKDLHESIETWATSVRTNKEKEWRTKTEEYARLSKSVDESTCLYLVNDNDPFALPVHDDQNCRRCFLKRTMNRIQIQAYEHPLPSDPFVAKAVIFDLLCPQTLATYRDVTWTIMSYLAMPAEEGIEPKCWAREYQQLHQFSNNSTMSCSLASVTKPFLTTHYATLRFPVEWDDGRSGVCRPNGLKLTYYDDRSKRWPSRRGHLSFLQHVKLQIPRSPQSAFSQIIQDTSAKTVYGASSYEIMATASRCPQGTNVHEYLAFQTVASGKSRRWLSILTELASANLNFSNEATVMLLCHLAIQCGPLDSTGSAFRLIHEVFRDPNFCMRFLEQLSFRLDSLSANCRETHLMELIITFTIRTLDFAWEANMPSIADGAISLLLRARATCVRWFKLLRIESYKFVDAETAQRFQQYALWAAILCKRTFTPLTHGPLGLDGTALETYIQSSIMLNDNLVVKLEALPQVLQHAIIRDIRLSYRLSELVSESILQNPEAFRLSLREMWPEEEGCARTFNELKLEPEAPLWISCRTGVGEALDTVDQMVFYNFVQGTLLVDGRPMGESKEWRGLDNQKNEALAGHPLFNRVTRILDSFEDRDQILVYQPEGRNLAVELRRLNLTFHTNKNRLLQSPQLQCQIDENQDAGTWYGLRSKLVCTSLTNPMHRSILVPLGHLVAQSDGCHVTVRSTATGKYGRFNINTTLGRIDCAPEPTLVFTKALLHACTSFLLPDPLTGRTGTEEAIQWLQAGVSQPWTPLTPPSMAVLRSIAQLTPQRVYYPQELKVMRTDYWIDELPLRLQNSAFRPIVDRILEGSATLAIFATKDQAAIEQPELPPAGEPHLHARVLLRQEAVERYLESTSSRAQPVNRHYASRDRPTVNNIMHRNVLEVTHLICQWPKNFKTTDVLAQILSQGGTIGGFVAPLDATSLNERLKVDILQSWGSLVRFAREAAADRYKLMYLLGPMSFHLDANMPLLRTLVASAVFADLNDLELPQWEEFEHFQPNQTPQLDYVLQLLKPYKVAPAESVAAGLGQYSSGKVLRKLQIERAKHESKVEEDCKFFANHLLSQWPCLEPTVSGLERSLLIDIGPALEAIRPEWRRLFMNRDLAEHVKEVQAILDRRTLDERYEPPPVPSSEEAYTVRIRGGELVDLRQLLAKPYHIVKVATGENTTPTECRGSTDRPFLSENDFSQRFGNFALNSNRGAGAGSVVNGRRFGIAKTGADLFPTGRQVTESATRLRTIAQRLGSSKSAVRRRYADDFQQSLNAFERLDTSQRFTGVMKTRDAAISLGSKTIEDGFYAISSALNVPSQVCSQRRIFWLKAGNLWPIVTKSTLLSCLGSVVSQGAHFGSGMKKALINMGVNITKYQREVRLHDLALKKVSGRYHEEDSNEGHSNWSPEEYPDWLLLEIESDMMIRPVQIDVALATISPESGSNSVLQMNMGQGK